MKIILCFIFLISCISLNANEVDSLLKVLDQVIADRPTYNIRKQNRLDSLKNLLITTNDLEQRFQIHQKLFKEYRHYNMDTALIIANDKYTIAKDLNNEDHIIFSEMNIAEILAIMGLYKEALDIMDKTYPDQISKDHLPYYYHIYHSTYSLIAQSSFSPKEKDHYLKLISQYKDSILLVNTPESLGYNLVKNGKLVEQGKYDEALKLMQVCYLENAGDESLVGTIAYGLSDVYEKLGDREQQKKYLAISAIADLRRAIKGYISLRKLAILLYEDGDVDRAYTYIKCSMEDATFCKARFRTLEISENLPVIIAAYDQKMKEEKNNLVKYVILISILTIILVISILFIYRQLRRLASTRRSLKDMYIEIKQKNDDVKQMNLELTELNTKLSESNLVKEVYIGSVFNLYSTYIDKMEAYRININRKLKAGQISEATRMTGSTSLVSEELREFFRNFDAIFLSIYPNFVEQFNSLLKEEEQIIPKADDILTPELRVFALVRLGIKDSSKIATFFHYSPQTVYNYKLKIRNKLVISKEEFESAILKIGK